MTTPTGWACPYNSYLVPERWRNLNRLQSLEFELHVLLDSPGAPPTGGGAYLYPAMYAIISLHTVSFLPVLLRSVFSILDAATARL